MRRVVIVGLGMAVLLAGCGNKVEHKFKSDDGSEVKVVADKDGQASVITAKSADGSETRIEQGGGWPAVLATLAPAYPGGKLVSTMSGSGKDGGGVVTSFETTDPGAKVIDFYASRAAAAGYKESGRFTSGDTSMFTAADEKAGHALTVQASTEQGKTTGVVSFSTSKPQ